MMQIGHRIAKLRASHGESLREAAVRTGVSHTTIARIETGEITRSMHSTIRKIADGYGVPAEFLLTGRTASQDFDTLFTTQAQEQQGEVIPAEKVHAFVRLMRKAVQAGIEPDVLDLAIDILVLQNGRLPSSNRVS